MEHVSAVVLLAPLARGNLRQHEFHLWAALQACRRRGSWTIRLRDRYCHVVICGTYDATLRLLAAIVTLQGACLSDGGQAVHDVSLAASSTASAFPTDRTSRGPRPGMMRVAVRRTAGSAPGSLAPPSPRRPRHLLAARRRATSTMGSTCGGGGGTACAPRRPRVDGGPEQRLPLASSTMSRGPSELPALLRLPS